MSTPVKPFLIITCGLTASGKTDLAKKVIMDFNLVPNFNTKTTPLPYTHMLIDDYVEESKEYNKHMNELLKDYNLNKNSTDEKILEFIRDSEVIKKVDEIYFGVRSSEILPTENLPENKKYKSCDIGKDKTYECKDDTCVKLDPGNKNGKSICNRLFDCDLKNLISQKQNIVLENIGKYIPTWLWENCFIKDDTYNVYIAYSLVNVYTLNERIPKRVVQQFKEYLQNRRTYCPRIPSFGIPTIHEEPNRFINDVYIVRYRLFELINACKKECIPNIIKNGEIRKVNNSIVIVVYDNNEAYESVSLTNFTKIFNSAEPTKHHTNIIRQINKSMGIIGDLRGDLTIILRNVYQPSKNRKHKIQGGTRRRRKHVRKSRRKHKRRLL
jgi:hypothetical protein